LDLNVRKTLLNCYILSKALYGAETWALRKIDQEYLENFGMLCWRRIEKISWTDRVNTKGQRRENYQTNNKKKNVKVDWSQLACKLHSKTGY
jgi:hypothetical protein